MTFGEKEVSYVNLRNPYSKVTQFAEFTKFAYN